MSQAITEKSLYRTLFEDRSGRTSRTLPAWVERLRTRAIERFDESGFPTTDDEDWKYTNVAPIAKQTFALASTTDADALDETTIEPFIYEESRASRLVFVNGIFRENLSSLEAMPPGVLVSELGAALTGEHAEMLHEHLARHADDERDAFAALNTAFIESGVFISVPEGVRVESPVHLLFLSTRAEHDIVSFPRVLVVAGANSSVTVIEHYAATDDAAAYFTNAVVEVSVGDGAQVHHYKVQREGERAFHVAATHADLRRSSSYDLTTITLGAQLSRHGIVVKLDHEGAECRVDGLYIVNTGQHADTHSLIDHRKPHCTSHQTYKGILDGKSRAVFNGRVFVHRDAQQTDAQQSNKNLLLSNEARVDTKPQLEIFADDVKCAHGATVGQLDAEELFYLASRGLHTDLARNLLTYGFAEEIVEKIGIQSIKAQLDEEILRSLHARLEA